MPAHKKQKSSRSKHALHHHLHKAYFMEEQEEFFRKHPLAQMLISIFIFCVVVFLVVVYLLRYR